MGVSAKDISNFEYRGHRRDIGGGFFNSVGMWQRRYVLYSIGTVAYITVLKLPVHK